MIRVRAWHNGHGKMFSPEEMAEDQLTLLPTGKFINVSGKSKDLSTIFEESHMWPLLSSGFNDVDKVEVFQGDIIELTKSPGIVDMSDPNPVLRIIGIDPETGGLGFLLMNGKPQKSGYTYCRNNIEKICRVVGNIFKNPELLEE